jgi:hypothetical protein
VNPVSQLPRRFRVRFDDRKTVPNAGLVIPLRLADRLGVTPVLNRLVSGTDRSQNSNGGEKALNLVAMLLAGGEFISDVGILAAGSTLGRLGYQWFSESRLGEWLRSLTDTDIGGMADALTEVTAQAWSQGWGPDLDGRGPADPLVLDVDGTLTQTYGTNKDGTGDRNYQGVRGYAPLLAVEASTGQVIAARLRAGNASPANGAAVFTGEALGRLRSLTGGSTSLLLRGDSGFYLRDLFDQCQIHDARFSVTVRQVRPVRDLIEGINKPDWYPVTHTGEKRIDIAAVPYLIKGRAGKGDPIPCRLIVRRVTTPADTGRTQPRLFDLVDYHAFVTDQPGDPTLLWYRHNQRAAIEATIRDLKYGLGLNHFPSGSYTANAAWLQLNTLTHNLCRWTNQLITPQPLTTKTLRYRYFTLPGRITTAARTNTLHLPQHWPHQHHITHALTTINQAA